MSFARSDFGENTIEAAEAIDSFDQGEDWAPVEDETESDTAAR